MKIIRLVASNFKGLKCVFIEPKSPLVKIEGMNAHGKSSVLDCIESAIRGGRFAPKQPIRIGEKKGEVEITLSDEEGNAKLIITRIFKGESSALRVTDATGRKFPTPQTFLDAISDGLSFDPMEFFNLVGLAKVEMLKRALGLDFTKEDDEIETISGKRTIAFQRKRGSEHAARKFVGVEKVTVPNIDEVKKNRSAAVSINNDIAGKHSVLESLRASKLNIFKKIEYSRSEYSKRKERIQLLQEEIRDLECENIETEKTANELKKEEAALVENISSKEKEAQSLQPIDLSNYDSTINAHSELSVKAERYKLKVEAESEVEKFANEWGELDGQINTIREQKKAKIAATVMPVQGMSFEEDTISINGVDIAQVNSAIQIETSLKIAMALNPKLKVIRIKSGSLLDDKSMMKIEEIAEKEGFQVWIEIVESEKTSSNSFFISDGCIT